MKKIVCFVCMMIPLMNQAQNNMEIIWQGCYGGSDYEYISGIVTTENGYLLFGETRSSDGDVSNNHGDRDIWIVSIDNLGELLWERSYGGSGPEMPNNIIKTDNNSYYFGAGAASNDGDVQSENHGGYDRWIVKINAGGDILWENCYGGSMTEYGGFLNLMSDGNIMTYGATFSSDGDVPNNYGFLDVWLMIITPDGEILQSKVFGNIGQNNVFDIVETKDGGFFMASKAQEEEGMVVGDFHGNTDVWAVKLDPDLNIEWQKLYGGSEDDYGYHGVLELEDGYLFLASTNSYDFDVSGFHGGFNDIWAVRIDTVGNIIWEKCYGGSSSDWSGTLHQTADGGFVIVGETTSNNGDVSGNDSNEGFSDIWMVKLNSDGELEWQQCYGGIGNERIYKGVVQKNDNNWVIAGRTTGNSYDVDCDWHGGEDFWAFEIKDCSQYPVGNVQSPIGPDTACTVNDSTNQYAISPVSGAWYYEWQLAPQGAGALTGNGTQTTVNWAAGWEGTATIVVRAMNDCDTSQWSQPHYTEVFTCLGVEELNAGQIKLRVYPNPARDYVVFELSGTESNKQIKITIMDVYGQIIERFTFMGKQGQQLWDTRKVKPGIYLYTFNVDGKTQSGKIVIGK